MELRFWKYEGTGNDFIMIDSRSDSRELRADTIRSLCDRHRGIGADGLIILLDHPGYDFRMRYFNADGGEAEMCGNGGRCIALFADDLGIGGDVKRFLGKDGPHEALIVSRTPDGAAEVRLGMTDVEGYQYADRAFTIDTGVPHYVEFVDDVDSVDVDALGRARRNEERFADCGGTNVNFVESGHDGTLKIRTYERGVEGETLACGTGATAAAIAASLLEQPQRKRFEVKTRGGILRVGFETYDNEHFSDIFLAGPARRVFEGVVKL